MEHENFQFSFSIKHENFMFSDVSISHSMQLAEQINPNSVRVQKIANATWGKNFFYGDRN